MSSRYLRRLADESSRSIYQDVETGARFTLRPVNRTYRPGVKRPTLYLSRLDGDQEVYVSGLFLTRIRGLFSLDIGGRVYRMRMFDAGAAALLELGPASQYREPSREVLKHGFRDSSVRGRVEREKTEAATSVSSTGATNATTKQSYRALSKNSSTAREGVV